MAARLPAKSILKQSSPELRPTLSDEEKAKVEKDRKNLGIALFHANKIQHQKDVQAQILSNIEKLTVFPLNPTSPSSDAANFISLVQPFQPSDFDSLVEERHIDGKCGYALCPNAPRSKTMGAGAAWKLKGNGAQDYCSYDCLRKALYVKSQLSEIPAWEREPGQDPQIVLFNEALTLPSSKNDRSVSNLESSSTNKHELALERGETASSFRPGQVMTSNVVEKANVTHKPTATFNSSHTAIEGYEPTTSFDRDSDTSSQHDYLADDVLAGNASPDYEAAPIEDDEREAWQGLYESIDKH